MRAKLDCRAVKAGCAECVGGVAHLTGFAPAVQPIGGVDGEIRCHQIRALRAALYQLTDMVSFNGIKRALVVALMHALAAVIIGDKNMIIFRSRMPRLADFQRGLFALNRDVPVKFSINGAMQMRVKAVIIERRFGFGIGT